MSKTNQPNIILFFVDQLRRDALGCYGNTICRTPNLDRVAQEGVRFENAFTPSPVCSPARASLMTGLYPHNNGVTINTHIAPAWNRGLDTDIPTFSSVLKRAGYALDYAGKWHVHEDNGPCEYGFDRHAKGFWGGKIAPDTRLVIEFPGGSQTVAAASERPKEESGVWRVTDKGLAMLRERAAGEGPFFLRIDPAEPHFANIVPEPYDSMYDPSSIPPWPNFDETFEGKPAGHLRKHREWHLENKDWDWWSKVVAKYYGAVSLIDECVGRVLDAVLELGLDENTIFMYTSDHGDATGSHKHFEKAGTMYDEVFRLPLVMRAAKEWASVSVVTEFVSLVDFMPTFVEWAGAKLPVTVDGRSFVSLLHGKKVLGWPDSVYCEHHGEVWGYQTQRMVRTSTWKYVYSPHDLDELYDLVSDPWEMKNLIDVKSCADVLREMKARLLGWNDATADMFQWPWVRWNFPESLAPEHGGSDTAPLTHG